jgi:hypothetical protein
MNRDYISYLVHHSSIEELLDFYKIKYIFGQGISDYFDRELNNNLSYLSRKYGYPTFSSFQELVEYHQDKTSPLRDLSIVDEFVVITRDQKVPYSLEDFLKELKKTKLKGLRVIPKLQENEDGSYCVSLRNVDQEDDDENSVFILRDGDEFKLFTFPPEWVEYERDGTWVNLKTISNRTEANPEDVTHYFDPSWTDFRGVFEVPRGRFFETLAQDILHVDTFCYIEGIKDDGAMIYSRASKRYDFITFNVYPDSICFCHKSIWARRSRQSDAEIQAHSECFDFDFSLFETLSLGERVSYLDYLLEVNSLAHGEHSKLNLPFRYGSVKTKDSVVVVFDHEDEPRFNLEFTSKEKKGRLVFVTL